MQERNVSDVELLLEGVSRVGTDLTGHPAFIDDLLEGRPNGPVQGGRIGAVEIAGGPIEEVLVALTRGGR